MLILTERNPESSLYFLGSEILKILSDQDEPLFLSEIHTKLSQNILVGLNRVILTLDWLFMVGLIDGSKQGKISLCI
ncbi:ABC-three component system middle component 6 [Acinetobacter sp.]|uniref:ABC-three component system middle component 6 n=1 Tax=Acinetobacter sp. TaxID=472 RepID=UPI003B003DB4